MITEYLWRKSRGAGCRWSQPDIKHIVGEVGAYLFQKPALVPSFFFCAAPEFFQPDISEKK